MNSKERILSAMRREEVDHVPCEPFFNTLSEEQRAGQRWQWPFGPALTDKIEYLVEV